MDGIKSTWECSMNHRVAVMRQALTGSAKGPINKVGATISNYGTSKLITICPTSSMKQCYFIC